MLNPTAKMPNTRRLGIFAASKGKQAVFAGLSAKALNRRETDTFVRGVSIFGWRATPIGDRNLADDSP